MSEPTPRSDAPITMMLIAAGCVTFTCLASFLGPALIPLIITVGAFALFTAVNYYLWGWRLKEGEDESN